jgi:hypothetical protein
MKHTNFERKQPFQKGRFSSTFKPVNDTKTENNDVAHSTTLSACLDFFSQIGASRRWTLEKKVDLFTKAFDESPLTAMKILFHLRNIRSGVGERQAFRDIMSWMLSEDTPITYAEVMMKNIHLVPFYGRWDDLWQYDSVIRTEHFEQIIALIAKNIDSDGLLCKWLPRKGIQAVVLRQGLKMSPKKYRNTIVAGSKTVEQLMSSRQWKKINYEHVPSCAQNKYRTAFYKRDEKRFREYIDAVTKGEKKMHASVISPVQLYQAYLRRERSAALLANWDAIPRTVPQGQNLLVIADTSGSMNGTPRETAIALGVKLAEENSGDFKNLLMTFNEKPSFINLRGTLYQKFEQVRSAGFGNNTNLVAVFTELLARCVKGRVPQTAMPKKVIILTDMQFDGAQASYHLSRSSQKQSWNQFTSSFDRIKGEYKKAGYSMPGICFCNLRAVADTHPVQMDTYGTCMVSGASMKTLLPVFRGEIITPMITMMQALSQYKQVRV